MRVAEFGLPPAGCLIQSFLSRLIDPSSNRLIMEQTSNSNGRVVKAPPLSSTSSRSKVEPETKEQDDVEMTDRANTPSTGAADELSQGARTPQADGMDTDDEQGDDQAQGSGSTKLSKKDDDRATLPPATEEEDTSSDPNLLASYPIYLNNSLPSTSSLQLLQYPTYPRRQPLPLPKKAAEQGLKHTIRWRPRAGWVQVEIPLDTRSGVYSEERAAEMGRGAAVQGGDIGVKEPKKEEDWVDWGRESKKSKSGRKGKGKAKEEEEIIVEKTLDKIRLESDVMPNLTTYCIGVMNNSEYWGDIGRMPAQSSVH